MNTYDWIKEVQQTEYGYIVNGNMHVPNDPANSDCQAILAWIAEGNMPIPEQPAPYYDLLNGAWVVNMEKAKSAKISEIQQASNSAIAAMTAGYTVGEVQSFEQQRRGAADLLAGNTETEDAQYVAALAAARAAAGDEGMTALELAGRIAANAAAATQATIAILGMQQGLEVRARSAETIADLEAIAWSMEASS